jgi:hypothetical protein
MPESIAILSKTYSDPTVSNPKGRDGTISVWYKGNRYGYAQKAMYSPILDRYINEYTKPETMAMDIKLYMYSEVTPYPMTLGEYFVSIGARAVENIHVVDKFNNLPKVPEITTEILDENGNEIDVIIHSYFIKETKEFWFYIDGDWININA